MQKTQKVYCHNNDFEGKLKDIKKWKTKLGKQELFLRSYQGGGISGEISSNGNLLKIFYDLKIISENLKNADDAAIKKFKEDLLTNKILSYDKHVGKYNGRPYGMKRKKSLFYVAREYLKFSFPEREDSINKILNIKIKIKREDKEIFTDDQLKQIRAAAGSHETKTKIELFDLLGCRAEEAHNIRLSDVVLPTKEKQFVQIRLRDEFSKTAGRTVHMFGRDSIKIVKQQLAARVAEKAEPEDTLLKTVYDTTQKQLKAIGEKLGIPVYAHKFRHTTATRMAPKLNRQQLCIWFGWRFSSPMPDQYIQRNGVEMDSVVQTYEKANVEVMQTDIDSLKQIVGAIVESYSKQESNIKQSKKQKEEQLKRFLAAINVSPEKLQ